MSNIFNVLQIQPSQPARHPSLAASVVATPSLGFIQPAGLLSANSGSHFRQVEGSLSAPPAFSAPALMIDQDRHGSLLTHPAIAAQISKLDAANISTGVALFGEGNLVNQCRVDEALLQATISLLAPENDIDQKSLDLVLLLLSDSRNAITNSMDQQDDQVRSSDLDAMAASEAGVFGCFASWSANRYLARPLETISDFVGAVNSAHI